MKRSAAAVARGFSSSASSVRSLVVCIHGSPGSERDFRHFATEFGAHAPGSKLVCLTQPGYAGREAFLGEPTVDAFAASAWDDIDEWGSAHDPGDGGVFLVGHSLGGHVAVTAALQRPERVRGVALIAGLGHRPHRALGSKNYPWVRSISRWLLERQDPVTKPLADALIQSAYRRLGFSKHISLDEINWSQRRVCLMDWETMASRFTKLHTSTFQAFATNDILIEEDIFREMTDILDADGRRHGPRLAFDSGGHNIQKHQAQTLVPSLVEWMAQIENEDV